MQIRREREREREREAEHRCYCNKASHNDVRCRYLEYNFSTDNSFLSRFHKQLQPFTNNRTTRFGIVLPCPWLRHCWVVPP